MSLPHHAPHPTTEREAVDEPYISMAKPLENAEGRQALESSGDSNKESNYFPADVEAAPALSDGQDQDRSGGMFTHVRGFMRSRIGIFLRDMFLICLLLGWWIPGIIREVSDFLRKFVHNADSRKQGITGLSPPSGHGSSSSSSW